jgi:hypothetical protein
MPEDVATVAFADRNKVFRCAPSDRVQNIGGNVLPSTTAIGQPVRTAKSNLLWLSN